MTEWLVVTISIYREIGSLKEMSFISTTLYDTFQYIISTDSGFDKSYFCLKF